MKSKPIAILGIGYVLVSAALATDTAEKPSPETTAALDEVQAGRSAPMTQ